jgi:hypothetical protein
MKILASRELSARPGAVWSQLQKEGALVITRDGQPVGIITPTSAKTLLDDMQDIVFAKARNALTGLRRSAADHGLAELELQEINAEIRKARNERKYPKS